MQVYHGEILQTCFVKLVEELEPDAVMRYLYEKGIITEDDMEDIRSNGTRCKMNEALILLLKRKGPNAFKRLVEGMQKNQAYLADILLDEGKTV